MSTDTQGQHVDAFMLDLLLTHILRQPKVFQVAQQNLLPEHFMNVGEGHYRAIWETALEYWNKYHTLPTYQALSGMVLSRMEADPGYMPETIKTAADLMEWMYGPQFPETELSPPAAAMEWLQDVLMDRVVGHQLREQMRIGGGFTVKSLPAMVTKLSDLMGRVAVVQSFPTGLAVPERWEESAVPLRTTGIKMLDDAMFGGVEPGEVHVILGPTGVGKTMLGTQILTASARVTNELCATGKGTPELSVYFSYESPARDLQVRVMSYAARIQKTRLERMATFDDLTTEGKLMEYEINMQRANAAAAGSRIAGERERLDEVRPWLNKYLRLVDFTGVKIPGEPVRGYRGLDECREVVDHFQQSSGYPVGTIVLDWAGMIVERYLRTKGLPLDRNLTTELSSFVDRVHEKLTAPTGARAYVIHQVTGQANKKRSGTMLHHSEAMNCATFAVNAWFAFCLGNKDNESNTCKFGATKTRRGEGRAPVVCRINGGFGELVPTDGYEIDQLSGRIVERSLAARVARPVGANVTAQRRVADTGELAGI